MTLDEIKAISIKDYLGSMSIYPINELWLLRNV